MRLIHSYEVPIFDDISAKGIGLKTIAAYTGHTSTDQLCTYIDVGLLAKTKALEALD